ncbi:MULTISPECIES: monovalent cation/H(+) antiporter subunit G [Pusillimonas]|uniref:Monovalent cation/H(+) antiporter subunit G n=1 Tax=Pusillimonas minor TaxID=2697024 RepID=A0A842HJ10_9BURK|nr:MULTISPECIES: monovalent cation/H(+) antiporter subunit G [Pusillimonas]MBC2768317.1 monovalent cation/H(+) antiporter subunit G [Pusillimonas minor]OXR49559.1 cation:proton antiporter [Pusillimonas sp. T2]ROT44330.1 cation:proton antiporter [Pusillimonas sp. NJUB218]
MNSLPLWASIPATLLLIVSGVLTLSGSLGLLRFKRFYSRMHAPTLGNTLGITFVLCASALVSSALQQRPVIHELLITFFLIVTSPITAIVLMQAGVRRDPRQPVSEE